jgi:fluoride exporter
VHVLTQIGLVAIGSVLGGVLRWGIGVGFGRLLETAFQTTFPWATFFINISGSMFLGWFLTVVGRYVPGEHSWFSQDGLRLMVAVGFTGAYTTFSTFEFESHKLLQDGDNLQGITYMLGSVFLGLVAVRLGMKLAGAE